MSIEKKAEIEIDVKGAERAAAAARASLSPWAEQAERVKGAFKSLGGELKSAVGGVLRDLSSVVTVGSSISFAGAVQGVKALELAASKMAVASGRGFDEVKAKVNDLSKRIGTAPEQVAAYISSVGKATYNFSGAEKSLEAFNKFAKESGRELSEAGPLAAAFDSMGVENAEKALRQLRGTAEQLKTVGGVAALADQFAGLSSTLSRTKNDAGSLIATLGALGKGLTPEQAQHVQQSVIGGLESRASAYEAHYRYTGKLKPGESLFDPTTGKLDVVKLARLRQSELRGLGARGERLARGEFGATGGARFLHADLGITGQESDTDAVKKYAATPGGKAEADRASLDRNMQAKVGHDSFLGSAREWWAGFAGNNPLTAYGIGAVGAPTIMRLIAKQGIFGAARALPGAVGVGGGALAATAGLSALSLAALTAATAPLNRAMPQIREETAAQLEGTQLGRVRALVRAAERSGGSAEGFVREAGKPLLANAEQDPALRSLAQQLIGGNAELKDLPENVGQEVARALQGSPLHITVVLPGGERITQDQPGGQQ